MSERLISVRIHKCQGGQISVRGVKQLSGVLNKWQEGQISAAGLI